MKVYSFEKLACWQQARQLAVWIYQITKKFPADEKFGIISQMRRAAISIASNIAEGTLRKTTNDQSHFSSIAYSSTLELLNDLIIENDLGFITNEIYEDGREKIERQTLLIAGLRKSQQKAKFPPSYTSKPYTLNP
jgi:four helix bundle protein